MNLRIPFDRVNWINTSFLFVITSLAVIGAPIYLLKYDLHWAMWALFGFYMIATGLSITLGYHRLFSHLSFKAKMPVRLFTLIFGACAFENSALHWSSDHRRHHKHTDHDDDPYDISKGFFWAHMGWILFKLNAPTPMNNVQDLQKDSLVRFQDKHCVLIAFFAGLLLPAVIGYFVMGGMVGAVGGFLIVGALRVVLVQQSTFFINSLCHTIGSQPYSTQCSARDSWIMALVTYGEGYHNYHHEFQHDYRNGVKVWSFDPTKWAILILHKLGLVSNLRRVPTSKIIAAEMQEAHRKAEAKLAELLASDSAICEHTLARVYELLAQLKTNLREFESSVAQSIDSSRATLKRWRRETRELVRGIGALRLAEA